MSHFTKYRDDGSGTCRVMVDRARGARFSDLRPCGRPLEEGTDQCSLHNKAEARAELKRQAERDRTNRSEAVQREGARLARAIDERFGVDRVRCVPHYAQGYGSRMGGYTRRVEVPFEVLERILGEEGER